MTTKPPDVSDRYADGTLPADLVAAAVPMTAPARAKPNGGNGSGGPDPPAGRFDGDDGLLPHPSAGAVPKPTRAEWLDGETIFDPEEPVPFLCRDLYICPGRHMQIQGYGYSGKTVAAMALALAVATGLPIWGQFPSKQGIVGHIDHEQGRRATKRRYLRLARHMGITREQLKGQLKILCLPDIRLSDPDAEDWLIRETAGMSLCIIDSLRATILGYDENDSGIRAFLDKLLRVSEQTQCTFVLVHHAGKNAKDKDRRETGRGNSAIFDSAGTVLALTMVEHDEPQVTISKVQMTKSTADADGGALEPFYLRIEDIASSDASELKWGLACAFRSLEQVDPPESPIASVRAVGERVIAALTKEPGLSSRSLRTRVRCDQSLILPALELLERDGKAEQRPHAGKGRGVDWFVTEPIGDDHEST